jgi:hypothetical protein
MRSAKLAINTNTTSRIFPGSIVVHANPASPARIASEIHFFVALDITSIRATQSLVHRGGFEPP